MGTFQILEYTDHIRIISGKGLNIRLVGGTRKMRSDAANLITEAANQCISVNPDNPLAPAQNIKAMYEVWASLMVALEESGSESAKVRIAYNLCKPILSQVEAE